MFLKSGTSRWMTFKKHSFNYSAIENKIQRNKFNLLLDEFLKDLVDVAAVRFSQGVLKAVHAVIRLKSSGTFEKPLTMIPLMCYRAHLMSLSSLIPLKLNIL